MSRFHPAAVTLIYRTGQRRGVPILRPCKTTAAFEALPDDASLQVDLDRLEAELRGEGWDVVVNAAVMLIVKKQVEVSVYRSGRMLLKTRDPDVARALFAEIHPRIEPDAPHEPRVEGLERLAAHAPRPGPDRLAHRRVGLRTVRTVPAPPSPPVV